VNEEKLYQKIDKAMAVLLSNPLSQQIY